MRKDFGSLGTELPAKWLGWAPKPHFMVRKGAGEGSGDHSCTQRSPAPFLTIKCGSGAHFNSFAGRVLGTKQGSCTHIVLQSDIAMV